MEKAKFTKGPWVVYKKTDGYGKIDIDDLVVGMTTFNENPYQYQRIHKVVIDAGNDCEEGRSNAHLIKMAPEMYAALDEVAEGMEDAGGSSNWHNAKSIRELLAKARGE